MNKFNLIILCVDNSFIRKEAYDLYKENGIPFYVAAPISTFDKNIENGSQIEIEERKREELSKINEKKIMPDWIEVRNPAFDVTPAKYVAGYITEEKIIKKLS